MSEPPENRPSPRAMPARGHFRGSALYHSIAYFTNKYGPAAAHTVIARLPPNMRSYVQPNAPALGILGARSYPYPFVGELVRTMRDTVHAPDEDVFVRQITYAGLEVLVNTMHRVLLRWLVSPSAFLERRQEIWELFHHDGRLNVLSQTRTSYVIEDADWSNNDPIVCKVNLEGRRRMLELMGLTEIEALREKCRAWGHDKCQTRFKWTAR
jgi:hypothetical protein